MNRLIIPAATATVATGLIRQMMKQVGILLSANKTVTELLREFNDGTVSFDEFPHYLDSKTRTLILNTARAYLGRRVASRHTRHRTILLSGQTELFYQKLANALAHHFQAKLLILHPEAREDESRFILAIERAISHVSKMSTVLVYIRDADEQFGRNEGAFQQMIERLCGKILILGSLAKESANISSVFSHYIAIRRPEDEKKLIRWSYQTAEDDKMIRILDNRRLIGKSLLSKDLECDDIESVSVENAPGLRHCVAEIVESALSFHLMNNESLEYRNGRLLVSSESLVHSLSLLQTMGVNREEMKIISQMQLEEMRCDAPCCDDEHERIIRSQLIRASAINVRFADIGGLDEVKESLKELVILPLRRPDLFEGGLLKPCRGVLLFGPPGTGKTMMAKAIAKEAGANFINVSLSKMTSMWHGEDEKNISALFRFASKLSPAIIFIDEVDSLLGRRDSFREADHIRKAKNEFMINWDGLLTKPGDRILVLAATNRPFDLDDAVLRRFNQRILVGLPTVEGRENIVKVLLSKEKFDDSVNFKDIATMTEGFSGSDIQNLCMKAAYRPLREFVRKEKESADVSLRLLNIGDFKQARKQIRASVDSSLMKDLKEWNNSCDRTDHLTYFI